MGQVDNASIIVLDKFIQATRDSGYRGTVSAVAELVDNSIQAKASEIHIRLSSCDGDKHWPIELGVLDNGTGMDRQTLRQSLRFGGSTRFNDRAGLGRYGMGLPNASLSQARRVEVLSWQRDADPLFACLDVDEIIAGDMVRVPEAKVKKLPAVWRDFKFQSGTLVAWRRCDRLDHRRAGTVARKLVMSLGRMFRYFLWEGIRIYVNGQQVEPVDPLYIRRPSVWTGGRVFEAPLDFEVKAPSQNGDVGPSGRVVVTFSELPVEQWHALSNDEKRQLGISGGAGVSIVRGGREVEYGWFFMNGKRKENYDDWWRCEVRFDPILDEAFGITHTKQQIHPRDYLVDVLAGDMETIAKALNARVRRTHLEIKTSGMTNGIERVAAERDSELRPIPKTRADKSAAEALRELHKRHPVLREAPSGSSSVEYRIVEDTMSDASFFQPLVQDGRVVVVVNPKHRFFKLAYGPLQEATTSEGRQLGTVLQAMLIAAARAEAMVIKPSDRDAIGKFRRDWSDALEVFLKA